MARRRRNRRSKRHSNNKHQNKQSKDDSHHQHVAPSFTKPSFIDYQDSFTCTCTLERDSCDVGVQTASSNCSSCPHNCLQSMLAAFRFGKCDQLMMPSSPQTTTAADASCQEIFTSCPNPFEDEPPQNPSQTTLWLSVHGSSNAIKNFENDSQESLLSMQKSIKRLISSEKRTLKASNQTLVLWKSQSKVSSVGKARKFFHRQTATNRLIKEKVRRREKENYKKFQRKFANDNDDCVEVPKSFSPKQRTMEKSMNPLGVSSAPIGATGGTFLQRIRVLHEKFSLKLLRRFISICTWFGLTIRMGLVGAVSQQHSLHVLSSGNFLRSQATKSTKIASKCGMECSACICFRKKVDTLERQVASISKDLAECRQQSYTMQELRREVADVKSLLKALTLNGCRKVLSSSACVGPPPPPPPPPPMPLMPPPPPPPLPLPPNGIHKLNKLDLPKRRDAARPKSSDHDGNVRPIISVDDILNVKLKKAGDRPRDRPASSSKLANTITKNTQPMVSMEMLKQVKLKPASRGAAVPGGCGASLVKNGCLTDSPVNSLAHVLSRKGEHNASSRLGA